jgi:hypothetical protein
VSEWYGRDAHATLSGRSTYCRRPAIARDPASSTGESASGTVEVAGHPGPAVSESQQGMAAASGGLANVEGPRAGAKSPCARLSLSILAAFLWVHCAPSGATELSQADFALPPPAAHDLPSLDLWATHYYDYPAREQAGGIPLRDKDGKPLTGNLSPKDGAGARSKALSGSSQREVRRFSTMPVSLEPLRSTVRHKTAAQSRGSPTSPWRRGLMGNGTELSPRRI